MKAKNTFIGALFIGIIGLTSCAGVPQAEVDAANAAISGAQVAGADIYLEDEFQALNDSMAVAMASLEEQKSKFFKKYDVTIEKLNAVTEQATELTANTNEVIMSLRSEITATISEVSELVAEARTLISEAPRGKEGSTALVAIKAELDAIETSMNESNEMFQSGQLKPTMEKLSVAREKASSINTELTEVISKYKTARK
ncbi:MULTISPECIES: hypothetical protein [Roseivirga]|mgnify:FL=1|jgi:uncharacterized coiled-coil DUF342 family protein|uniref:hypothetical protein n=1 Tax=Roseivirga TaxID=290180 RepID=UPI00082A5EAC|nr:MULTISPECIES: hypothetical protein [Roseivirga]MBO6497026.1 hypothetical protein [Roseivirga sp.]MBO6659390.1 hypothetical protein [Roseivirga sp.]MBO6762971.1 hypothetical protein [Roseivirga sp.]MBO6907873.1 hypothetical protein [Roseivirga sp.]WPZ10212.1 hypothetical protein T7867_18255 [Roseivirga spongicola]